MAEDEVVEEQLAVVGSLPGTLLDTERDELRELGAELSRGKRAQLVEGNLPVSPSLMLAASPSSGWSPLSPPNKVRVTVQHSGDQKFE